MAKVSPGGISSQRSRRKKRPGVHAKSKSSRNKRSKNYNKPTVGQGG